MKIKKLLIPLLALVWSGTADATPVKVTMNAVSTTMSLIAKDSETPVEVGSPTNRVYEFEAPAGEYILTGYGNNGTTDNGTILLNIADSEETQEFTILTCTAYVTNQNEDKSTWSVENSDYTLDVIVNTREGVRQTITIGNSTTAGRYTFLALNGNSYSAAFIPSEAHQAEGYTTLYKQGTLTFNVNVYGKIPMAADYSITLPKDAGLMVGMKFFHFIDYTPVEPKETTTEGDTKTVTYSLADGQVYNFRTWMKDGLTQGGYFTMSTDPAKRPSLNFTQADYNAFSPKTINHDVQSNQGYETGDIFMNINPEGYLKLNVGDRFDVHAMRTWELTDNSTNNYFFEPDFHYTVVDIDGKPSTGVIEIDNADTTVSAWSQIKAVGEGTAIVLVTYDAIGLNYYSGANKSAYLGGEYWGAIWPENTAAFVVTVGEASSAVKPNMLINEEYNLEALKNAGKYVDAEHDVFYYLDTEEGALYTFTPEGASDITIAYPTIGKNSASYTGFSAEGVTKNEDGSYTLLLKEGRQIVRLSDSQGRATYQVLTAKPCHREISNESNPGSEIFQPGDKVKIQYSGLRHPANKLAGIYNMSAYVTYNGIPNGSSLILGSGQYTFGSAASAQAVTIDIPSDLDVVANPTIEMTNGVIQVNGYGDPIGNHRIIDPIAGRSPNFTAVPHKTYFGMIPDVVIPISTYKSFPIRISSDPEISEITITYREKQLTPDEATGLYSGSFGTYDIVAKADGYRCLRQTFTIDDNADGEQTFALLFERLAEGGWDGKSLTEPTEVEGVYSLSTGAELAWYAAQVNAGTGKDGRLTADIDLGDFDWTPMGSSTKPFAAKFEGDGHTVSGLFIDAPNANNNGLFGYVKGASIDAPASVCGVAVHGQVTAKQYSAGVAGYIHQYSTVERCANYATVKGLGTYIGGVVGYIGNPTGVVTDCYNARTVTGTTNCGGVVGGHFANARIENLFNIGEVSGSRVAACVGGTTSKSAVKNLFATAEYDITDAHTLVSHESMASGEIAWRLGEAFGQRLGEDDFPTLGGDKVYRVVYSLVDNTPRISRAAADEEETATDEEEPSAIYTNGTLPTTLDGHNVDWYADEDCTIPATAVDADTMLYAKEKSPTSAIEEMEAESEGPVRWFNLQGIEVTAPAVGQHGIYIRVKDGRSEKIRF